MSSSVDQNILRGPEPIYEPAQGGLGYEIFRTLNSNTGKIAQIIISNGEINTYDDLLDKSIKTAIYLSRKQFCRGDIVCVLSEHSSNSLVPFIAAQFVGLKYVSLEPTIPEADLMYFFDYLPVKIFFVSESFERKLDACAKKSFFKGEIIVFGRSMKYTNFSQLLEISEGVQSFQPINIGNIKEEALIFLSSGTTGKPKGICVSHYALLAQTFNIHLRLGKGSINFSNFSQISEDIENANIMCYSPLSWISSILLTLMAFLTGGRIMIGNNFEAEGAWQAMKKYGPNMIFLPPGQVNELCSYANGKEPAISLDMFLTGGGLVSKQHIQNINRCFPKTIATQAYGQTENIGMVAAFDIHKPEELELNKKFPESCGRPISGIQVKIVNPENETICGVGMQGELRVKNKYFMNGYYKMDSSFTFDSDGWFKTGDLAYFDENGCIYIIDRIKDLLLYTVYNIRPSVIDNILSQHPAVFESVVIGYPHPLDNEHPMGIVVLKNEYKNKISQDEIIAYVNDRVPSDRYKIRAGIRFVDKLLRTATGKLNKIEMKQLIIAEQL